MRRLARQAATSGCPLRCMAYITSLCRTTRCFLSGPSSRSSEMSHATSNARPTRSYRAWWGHSDAIIAFSPMRAGGFAILGKRECYGHGVTGKRPRIFEHQLPPGLRLRRRGGPGAEFGRVRSFQTTDGRERLLLPPAQGVGSQSPSRAAYPGVADAFSDPGYLRHDGLKSTSDLRDAAIHLR